MEVRPLRFFLGSFSCRLRTTGGFLNRARPRMDAIGRGCDAPPVARFLCEAEWEHIPGRATHANPDGRDLTRTHLARTLCRERPGGPPGRRDAWSELVGTFFTGNARSVYFSFHSFNHHPPSLPDRSLPHHAPRVTPPKP